MKIAVIGAGYVGLPTAVALATLKHDVVCCERDPHRLQTVQAGRAPFADAGLQEALTAALRSGRLRFCADIAGAARAADAAMITVPVSHGKNGLNKLYQVTAELAAASDSALIVKSTVPPGACRRLHEQHGVCIAHNPEFLRQGFGFKDAMSPSRIVAGADDSRARRLLRLIYAPLIERNVTYIETSCLEAEIIKLAANAFLAARVALINDIADLCGATGGDIKTVTRALAADKRIGGEYLQAGIGFGGACLPKDMRLLLAAAKSANLALPAVKGAYDANHRHIRRIAERIIAQSPPRAVAAVWGAAFKSGADSIEASPAVEIIHLLSACFRQVRVCDPLTDAGILQKALPAAELFQKPADAAAEADILVTLNRQPVFLNISAAALSRAMRGKRIFDCADIFTDAACRKAGLERYAAGV